MHAQFVRYLGLDVHNKLFGCFFGLSFGALNSSFGALDLSFGALDLSFGALDLSFGIGCTRGVGKCAHTPASMRAMTSKNVLPATTSKTKLTVGHTFGHTLFLIVSCLAAPYGCHCVHACILACIHVVCVSLVLAPSLARSLACLLACLLVCLRVCVCACAACGGFLSC
jgi:hypothetical protein